MAIYTHKSLFCLEDYDRIRGVSSFQLDVIPKRKIVNRHVWVAALYKAGNSGSEKSEGSRESVRRWPMEFDVVDLEV
jgi:hypothetical protein